MGSGVMKFEEQSSNGGGKKSHIVGAAAASKGVSCTTGVGLVLGESECISVACMLLGCKGPPMDYLGCYRGYPTSGEVCPVVPVVI